MSVEGIRLDEGMTRDLRLSMEEAAPPEAARRMPTKKYGKATG